MLLGPVIRRLGYELVGVEHLPQRSGALVRVYIDAEGGVTLGDCERASRRVSAVLDVEDAVRGTYTLEVSSPGLDRPLFTAEHFRRFAGCTVKLRLVRAVEGRRQFRGRLCGVEGDQVLIAAEGVRHSLPLELIDRARVVPEEGRG